MRDIFRGYRRPDDRAGIRNHLLVLSSVVCANRVPSRLARERDDLVAVTHQHGCGHLGEDREQVLRILSGLGSNPNVGVCLVVGLGCENVPAEEIAREISRSGKPVRHLNIQEEGGVEGCLARAREILEQMTRELARDRRSDISLGDLVVGTQCGGSDFTSGLVANPAVGALSDLLVAGGAAVVLSETTEFIGAEHILRRRAASPQVARDLDRIIAEVEKQVQRAGTDLRGSQPSPGNMAGGLTTIEEKSLGCILKGGTGSIRGVVGYGQRIPGPGLWIMDTPGHDVESLTAMAAGGCQLSVFTTGRGTPVGHPLMPVIKVTGNAYCSSMMGDHIDADLSGLLDGKGSIETAGRDLMDLVLDTAGGEPTRSELGGHDELAIARLYPSV